MKKNLTTFLLGAATGWIAYKTCERVCSAINTWRDHRSYTRAVGRKLTDVELELADGRIYTFSEDRDKMVFVNLHLVGCGPCNGSTPNIHWLAEWTKKHKDAFDIITVCLGRAEDFNEDLERSIIANYHHRLAFVELDEFANTELGRRLKTTAFPTLYVISSDNRVVNVAHPATIYGNIEVLLG